MFKTDQPNTQLGQLAALIPSLPRQHVSPGTAFMSALKMPIIGGGNYIGSQTGHSAAGYAESSLGAGLGGVLGHMLGSGRGKALQRVATLLGGYAGQASGAYTAAVGSNERSNEETRNFLTNLQKVKPTPLLQALVNKLQIKSPESLPSAPHPATPSTSGKFLAGGGGFGGGGAGGSW
jgi:hypothetical protein